MTDHIVEANKKVIDLDALEKLADRCMKAKGYTARWEALDAFEAAANPATIKALISELREARGLLKSWVASAEAEYVEGLFYDDVKETRAFLSKAQGGE